MNFFMTNKIVCKKLQNNGFCDNAEKDYKLLFFTCRTCSCGCKNYLGPQKIQCIKDVNKGDKRRPAGWIQNGSYPSFQPNDTIIYELIIIIIQVENLKKFVFEKYFEIHLMYLQNVKINHILLEPYRDGSQNDLAFILEFCLITSACFHQIY
ncbi:hypothetical protein BpHYR1_049102 [Brachionus plicatilis]|uniref:Uncharacterized protein n=1 Tax=Brachionus plicatilis TaxID=10195 RepID=A0A3M7PUM8_BRAPC|nr:hypothetical protein BpHYR1_049102 [Brachionus plicatilis]